MNIESKISNFLWRTIESSYTSQNYSSAIIDAIFYLSNIIRERSGLESDGLALAGNALGGNNPKLKVNKLQTESDWNVQKGIEQLLRGIFQGIRNPRSHEKYNDNKDDADAIILFINYLLKIILESKSPFTKSEFLKKVFDHNFPENIRYSELLVNEIPDKYKLDVLIDIFRDKNRGNINKLNIFFKVIIKKFTSEEILQLSNVISKELEQINEESTIRETIQIIPIELWQNLNESARIRTEYILTESIKSGKYDAINKNCISGSLGTWASNLLGTFISKNDVLLVLLGKLGSDNKLESDYVFYYFFNPLFILLKNSEVWLQNFASAILLNGLKKGDLRFYDFIKNNNHLFNAKILNEIQEYFENFKPKEEAIHPDPELTF